VRSTGFRCCPFRKSKLWRVAGATDGTSMRRINSSHASAACDEDRHGLPRLRPAGQGAGLRGQCWHGRSIMLAMSAMSFGPFHVLPSQQLLLEGDRSLRLGSRAFDIMVALVEQAGQLVSKDEMRNLVWPGPSSKMAISKSRLRPSDGHCGGEDGKRCISTVAGRGYWFVASVMRSTDMDGRTLAKSRWWRE
jgi:DNA-binding winged helix-turn-helix (wHTH) protein